MILVCDHAATLPSKDNRGIQTSAVIDAATLQDPAYQMLSLSNAEVLWSRYFVLGISETTILAETSFSFLSWSHLLMV